MLVWKWLIILEQMFNLESSGVFCCTCMLHLLERLQFKCVFIEQSVLLLQGVSHHWFLCIGLPGVYVVQKEFDLFLLSLAFFAAAVG